MGYGCGSKFTVGSQCGYLGMNFLSLLSGLVVISDFFEPIIRPISWTSSMGVSVMMRKLSLLSWVVITKNGLVGLE